MSQLYNMVIISTLIIIYACICIVYWHSFLNVVPLNISRPYILCFSKFHTRYPKCIFVFRINQKIFLKVKATLHTQGMSYNVSPKSNRLPTVSLLYCFLYMYICCFNNYQPVIDQPLYYIIVAPVLIYYKQLRFSLSKQNLNSGTHTEREVGRGDCPVEKTIFTIFRMTLSLFLGYLELFSAYRPYCMPPLVKNLRYGPVLIEEVLAVCV